MNEQNTVNTRVSDIISRLEERYPPSAAEEWDNPGLLVGRRDAAVHRIFVTLDVSDETLAEAIAWEADLIVSHHPLIFGGLKQVNSDDPVGSRVLTLAERGIACYAMHTNYDVRRMAELNAAQLGLAEQEVLLVTGECDGAEEGIGRVGTLPRRMTLDEFAHYVKKQMQIPEVLVYGTPDTMLERAAVSGGSGRSVVGTAAEKQADVLVTGDLDYHTATDAVAGGMCIIDAGHYGTEYCFIADAADTLAALFPDCAVRGAAVRHPFRVI